MALAECVGGLGFLLAAPVVLRRHRLRSWPRWRIDASQAWRGWGEIVSKGAPAAVMTVSEWGGWEVALFIASGLCVRGAAGCAAIEAMPICTTLMVCQFILVFGWGLAASNRVGNLLGAGDGRAAKLSAKVAWLMAASSALVNASLILVNRRRIASLFLMGSDESMAAGAAERAEVLEMVTSLMPITTAYSVLSTLAIGWSQQILFGLGAHLRVPALINFLAFFAVGNPLGALLAYEAHLGVNGLWLGLLCGIALVGIGQYSYLGCTVNWAKAAVVARERALKKEGHELSQTSSDGQGLAAADSAKVVHEES